MEDTVVKELRGKILCLYFFTIVCLFVWSRIVNSYRLNLNKIIKFSLSTAPTTSVPWTTWSPWTSPSAQPSCNFDYGLCYGWSQSLSDVFDWTRRRGSTSSSNTGPSSDHTTGNGTRLHCK